MKLTSNTTALLKELSPLLKVTGKNLPILENFLFEIIDGVLLVTSSDLETTMTTSLIVTGSEDGKACLPAKLIVDTLKSLPSEEIVIETNEAQATITTSTGEYKFVAYDVYEYPRINSEKSGVTFDIESSLLTESINTTVFATSTDELRMVLTGIYVRLRQGEVTFVATDAHKLVKITHEIENDKDVDFIIPKKTAMILASIPAMENVMVSVDSKSAVFLWNNTSIICTLIEGKYPNFEAVIPQSPPYKLVIDRALLTNSVKRLTYYESKQTHSCKFDISENSLVLQAQDIDNSSEGKENMTCNYSGEEMEIGLNSKFLLEMLPRLSSKNVTMMLTAPNKAATIISDNVLMLLMPIMVK